MKKIIKDAICLPVNMGSLYFALFNFKPRHSIIWANSLLDEFSLFSMLEIGITVTFCWILNSFNVSISFLMLTLMNAIPEMSIVIERKIIQKRFNVIFSMTCRKEKLDSGYQLITENFSKCFWNFDFRVPYLYSCKNLKFMGFIHTTKPIP